MAPPKVVVLEGVGVFARFGLWEERGAFHWLTETDCEGGGDRGLMHGPPQKAALPGADSRDTNLAGGGILRRTCGSESIGDVFLHCTAPCATQSQVRDHSEPAASLWRTRLRAAKSVPISDLPGHSGSSRPGNSAHAPSAPPHRAGPWPMGPLAGPETADEQYDYKSRGRVSVMTSTLSGGAPSPYRTMSGGAGLIGRQEEPSFACQFDSAVHLGHLVSFSCLVESIGACKRRPEQLD